MTLDALYHAWTDEYWDANAPPRLYLSGVDKGQLPARHSLYEGPANCLLFVVNDVGYCVSEDPDDGYRSHLREISEIPAALIRNRFVPVEVRVQRRAHSEYEQNNTLELVDVQTDEVVLAFGTDNTTDYYPYFVAEWYPQHLAANIAVTMDTYVAPKVARTKKRDLSEGPRAVRLRDDGLS